MSIITKLFCRIKEQKLDDSELERKAVTALCCAVVAVGWLVLFI